MKKKEYFFENIDSNICYPLDYHMSNAKSDGLKEITLLTAILDNDNPDYVWCTRVGEMGDRAHCKKSQCAYYHSKSGRGVCSHRGKLYLHGEEVKFNVETSEVINN